MDRLNFYCACNRAVEAGHLRTKEKQVKKAALVILFLASILSGLAFAQEPQDEVAGAGQSGVALSLAYDGAQFNYKEESNPYVGLGILNKDKDTGWLNGVAFDARYDGTVWDTPFFARVNFDYLNSSNATFTGSAQGGTPTLFNTTELIDRIEADAGWKALNFRRVTLSPYLGIGFRYWERGTGNMGNGDYKETYAWMYGVAGGDFAFKPAEKLLLGIDAALLLPIRPEMKTDRAGAIDTTWFGLGFSLGYRIQLPASFDIYTDKDYKVFTLLTPYYEKWNIGQSPSLLLVKNGISNGQLALEPKSYTDLYGVRVGVGIRF
jgi:hypothetical protein